MALSRKDRIRYRVTGYLILFFLTFFSCKKTESPPTVSLVWDENRPTGLYIPAVFVDSLPQSDLQTALTVHLMNGENQPAILGKLTFGSEGLVFTPAIPFTRTLKYEVRLRNQHIAMFEVPAADSQAPTVRAIHPSRDSLPENLLKFYISFSRPMREGNALRHIALLRDGRDTLRNVFLDLRPELWNHDRTQLTIWLNPGRVKRDLKPNLEMGPPLAKGKSYQLIILNSWKDLDGQALQGVYKKDFTVVDRDTILPDPEKWVMRIPRPGSSDPLQVDFSEPLDFVLLEEAIEIQNSQGEIVPGDKQTDGNETIFRFVPQKPWTPGSYYLKVEARLEDLAGNNLNRPFDRDTQTTARRDDRVILKPFLIRGR